MRKVSVKVEVLLRLDMDEGVEVADAINEMDYNFTSTLDTVDVAHTEITNYEVLDSR
jgi:hypothetical protein